jgi:hypothetical protein
MTAQGPAIEARELNTRLTVYPEETLVLDGIYESRAENVWLGSPVCPRYWVRRFNQVSVEPLNQNC